MLVSKVRQDAVFDGFVEFPDGTKSIPQGHSFSLPPNIPEGYYAIMSGGWKLIAGTKPVYPPPEPLPPQPTAEEILKMVVDATQKRLDDFARTRNYDGILSLCTYATSPNTKFATEGQYGIVARDATWSKLYEMLDEVQAGTRPIPASFADIESELPVLEWPI